MVGSYVQLVRINVDEPIILCLHAGLVTSVNAISSTTLDLCHSYARMLYCAINARSFNCINWLYSPSKVLTSTYSSVSTGPNGDMCSGPDAGECVCGQCKCRQNVNPQVRLIPQYNYYKQDCTIGLCTTCVQQSVIPLFTSSDDLLRFNKKAFSTGCYLFY